MSKKQPLAAFTVRVPDPDYIRLQLEADEIGMNLGQYARHILINHETKKTDNVRTKMVLDRDFAETLATALAITIVTGAVTTEGLEDVVERYTLKIMQYLGVA